MYLYASITLDRVLGEAEAAPAQPNTMAYMAQ